MKYIVGLWQTEAGWMAGASSGGRLSVLVLPVHSRAEAMERIAASLGKSANIQNHFFLELIEQTRAYFQGQKIALEFEIDTRGFSPFQKKVYKETCKIPYGEVRSYGWIARKIGKPGGTRAVGQALKQNPVPLVIPCHRVVSAGGKIGGFSGGIRMKGFLLNLERADGKKMSYYSVKKEGLLWVK